MTQALKKTGITKPLLNQVLPTANTKKLDAVKTEDAAILNFDQSKAFSRFLEASCDCV